MRGGSSPLLTLADSPKNIPGMVYWYRGDAVHLTAGNVDTAIDKSGLGRNAVQAVGANQPVWGATSGPNGTPGWTSPDGVRLLVTPAINIGGLTMTNIVVLQPNMVAGTGALLSTFTPVITIGQFLNACSVLGSPVLQGEHNGTAGFSNWYSSPIVNNTPHIAEFQHNKNVVSEQIRVYTDGALTAQSTTGADADVTDPFGNFAINIGQRGNGTLGFTGVIAEIIGYTTLLTAQQRQNLYRGYLGPRYGIVVP